MGAAHSIEARREIRFYPKCGCAFVQPLAEGQRKHAPWVLIKVDRTVEVLDNFFTLVVVADVECVSCQIAVQHLANDMLVSFAHTDWEKFVTLWGGDPNDPEYRSEEDELTNAFKWGASKLRRIEHKFRDMVDWQKIDEA
ncbi:hypothetical protein MBLNU230_g7204t1 [Neophaeotheca triangularis]